MKEPKFRGFSKKHNQWFYGHGWFKIDWTEEYKKEKGIGDQAMLYTESSPVDCELESMGQYTGLTDNHGTEIYEGDIVKKVYDYKDEPLEIEITIKDIRFDMPHIYDGEKYMFSLEIIGNKYQCN